MQNCFNIVIVEANMTDRSNNEQHSRCIIADETLTIIIHYNNSH